MHHPDKAVFRGNTNSQVSLTEALRQKTEEISPQPIKDFPPKRPSPNRGLGVITMYLLSICTLLFLYGEFTSPQMEYRITQLPATPLYSSKINKQLLYDYPQAYEILDKLASAYDFQKLQSLSDLPKEGQTLLQQYEHTPYWKGFYDKLVDHLSHPGKLWNFDAPLFEKIRQGEFWRLFTPALLHLNVFHLFFNMIWLVVLGKLIEEKIGALRYIIFILIVAVVSNTAQYLMSGPNFIGISGVICGMLGFIWARQTSAAWEDYNLMPGAISFMFFFVLAMFCIQLISFLLQVYYQVAFMPGIANTAHIVGGLTGYLLGQLNAYSLKTKKS